MLVELFDGAVRWVRRGSGGFQRAELGVDGEKTGLIDLLLNQWEEVEKIRCGYLAHVYLNALSQKKRQQEMRMETRERE